MIETAKIYLSFTFENVKYWQVYPGKLNKSWRILSEIIFAYDWPQNLLSTWAKIKLPSTPDVCVSKVYFKYHVSDLISGKNDSFYLFQKFTI